MSEAMDEHVSRWLAAYHDGELRGARLAQVQSHLRTCALCQDELEELRWISSLLHTAPPPDLRQNASRFTANVMLQLPPARRNTAQTEMYPLRDVLTDRSLRWVRRVWQAVPLVLLLSWAFSQAVAIAIPQALLAISLSDPQSAELVDGLVGLLGVGSAFQALPLDGWLRALMLPEILLFEALITALFAALFAGWLASYWVLCKK